MTLHVVAFSVFQVEIPPPVSHPGCDGRAATVAGESSRIFVFANILLLLPTDWTIGGPRLSLLEPTVLLPDRGPGFILGGGAELQPGSLGWTKLHPAPRLRHPPCSGSPAAV